ncbi:MAG: acetyltransferase [Cyclobacteriaceae bacterium]
MMSKRIAIIGAGGLGKEILALIGSLPEWSVVGFYDDAIERGVRVNGSQVLGDLDQLRMDVDGDLNFVIAVGAPSVKKEILRRLNGLDIRKFPSIVHPSAIIMDLKSVMIGFGTIISAGCVLTSNISIGDHVLVNINSTIGHDCYLGDFSSVMPGANISGSVKVGEEVTVGSGANVMNGVALGNRCKVGMGATVLRDVVEDITVAGVPATQISKD